MWPCSLLPRTPTSNLPKGEQPYWVFKARAFLLWDEPEPLIPAWLLPKAPGRQHACRGGCEPNPRGSFINLCPTSYLVSNISTSASSKPVSRDDLGRQRWFWIRILSTAPPLFSIWLDTLFTLSSEISSFSSLSITLLRIMYNHSQMTHFSYVETSR